MAGFCVGYAEIFAGDLYRIIVGAVMGIAAALLYFVLGSTKRSGKDYRNTLMIKTAIVPIIFFLFLECIYSIFSLTCMFNVIRILGAGNLDTVGGYQVFDIEWIKILFASLALHYAFTRFHGFEDMHLFAQAYTVGGWTLLNFGISRTTSFDFVWAAFTMSGLIILLNIAMKLASSGAFSLKDWKLYVSEFHTIVYMVANSIIVMVANPVYNIRGSTFRAFFYPSITFVVAILAVIELLVLFGRRTGRDGDVARLYGNIATPEEVKASIEARKIKYDSPPALFVPRK